MEIISAQLHEFTPCDLAAVIDVATQLDVEFIGSEQVAVAVDVAGTQAHVKLRH